jgi:hypothetical protein
LPSVAAGQQQPGADQRERKAQEQQRRAEKHGRTSGQPPARADERASAPAVAGPAFVCDPARSHGENVSAYARSLPKGPGRGRLVSQAARSDCGKDPADD